MFIIIALLAALATPATPHCVNDDYNDGSQALCYTVNVQTGERVYIDRNDNVIPREAV